MGGRGRVRFELLLGQVLEALPRPPAEVVDAEVAVEVVRGREVEYR